MDIHVIHDESDDRSAAQAVVGVSPRSSDRPDLIGSPM